MERESDKHNPRVDEAMAHDVDSLLHGAPVESRAQEARLQEDPEVGPGRRLDEPRPGVEMSDADTERRAELSRHLAGVHFPARPHDLVAAAVEDHAPDEVVQALRALPSNQSYPTVQAVWQALGGPVEPPHTQPG